MGKPGVRSLDTALPASIDHNALNNQVVGMRKTVKRTKLHLINKMVKRIRVLKNFTKGSEQEISKKRRKADRVLQEIDVIKKLDPDQVSKYALSSTDTVKDIAAQPSGSVTKALAQYSCHKLMQDLVGKFRDKHPDWKALAAYLLAKNTGRRYKKKVTKEKVTAQVAATKREARDNLLNNFLQQKGAEDKDISNPSNILKQKNKEKKTKADSIQELSVSELKKSVETFDESGDESNDETKHEERADTEDESDVEQLIESFGKPQIGSNDESSSVSNDESSGESNDESSGESNDESSGESNDEFKDKMSMQSKKQKTIPKTNSTLKKQQLLPKQKSTEIVSEKKNETKTVETKRQSKHMVIQSFSLENSSADTLPFEISLKRKLAKDSSENDTDDNIIVPKFLTLNDSAPKVNRVKNDSFFMGGEDEEDSGTESIGDKKPSNDDGDSGSDLEESDHLQKGKVAMRSTFVGSLTDNRKDKMSTWAITHSTHRTQGGRGGFNSRKRPGDDSFQQGNHWERNPSRESRGGSNNGRSGQGDRRPHPGRWGSQPPEDRQDKPWERNSRESRGGFNNDRSGQGDRRPHPGRWGSQPPGDRQDKPWERNSRGSRGGFNNGRQTQGDRPEKQTYQRRENPRDNTNNSEKTDTEEKLHPSWQASKLRKQQTIQSFTGKKTTFNDD